MTNPLLLNIDAIFETCGERAEANDWRRDMPDRETDPAAHNAWIASKLMLATGELSEALEELRNGHEPAEIYYGPDGKPEGFAVEVADCIIRLADLWHAVVRKPVEGVRNVDQMLLPSMIIDTKLEYNDSRGARHGGKAL